jgi:DNA polymerase III subunit delta
MIVKPAEAERFTARPPSGLRAALVYGPDQGLVHERADALARSVVGDLSDPFRVAELDNSVLVSDPARFFDEAAALSMTGGRRVVRVTGAGNVQAETFEEFLQSAKGDALVVVEAGELAKSSALRRVFEGAKTAVAIPCYLDNAEALEDVVRAVLKEHGLSIAPDALESAVAKLGSDRLVTRRELEKLALYAMGDGMVTQAHVDAVMGDESELRVDAVCDAAAEADFVRLDRELSRLWAAGTSPVAVIRPALYHFQRLLLVRAQAEEGADMANLLRKLRPPLHFSRERAFRAQVSRFTKDRLETALRLLYEAEALVKTTGIPAEAVTARAFFSVAGLAKGAR